MNISILSDTLHSGLAHALEIFERKFTYPLGTGRTFTISHGSDYPRFFRAISPESSAVFVAVDRNGNVQGTLGVALRPLLFPTGECRIAAYLGDLKIAAGPNRGRTLLRLGSAATTWSKAHGAVVAYGVVMDGTSRVPSEYTGRFEIHAFEKIHRLRVLRIPAEITTEAELDDRFQSETNVVEEQFRKLSNGAFAPLGGNAEIRSSKLPMALLAPDRTACGILEDTRRAKRLISNDGQEMLSAHLSKFAYSRPLAGIQLIRHALALCEQHGIAPAMFVAVPEDDAEQFAALLGNAPGVVNASATIYGTEFTRPIEKWNISTSEI